MYIIEDITISRIKQISDSRLFSLRLRAIQLYEKYSEIEKREPLVDVDWDSFFKRYKFLIGEFDSRDLSYTRHPMDKILEKVKTSLVVEDFSSAPTQQIAKILFDKKDFKVADAMSFLKDDRAKRLLSEAVFEETEVENSDVVEDYILKIRKMSVERRLKELKNEIERKDSEGVVDYELLREYDQLSHIKLEGG